MSVIDDYLSNVPEPHKSELERIRQIVKQVVPEAQETISYGMPAFKYKNKPLIYFAAFKNHMSIFPTSGPTEELKDKLKSYKTSKGTIQFTVDKPLPESLITDILLIRQAIISKK
jgi:uncharacterized protein YdhG (YjbR/CyaY superfamily)